MFRIQPFNIRGNAEKGREAIEKVLDAAMDQPFNPFGRVSGALSSFRVDVTDSDDKYEIFAELPGFSKDEITVAYDDENRLSISAERSFDEDDDAKYICRERKRGKFERVFYIDDIVEDDVHVTFENGLLHVVLPKTSRDKNKKVFDIG